MMRKSRDIPRFASTSDFEHYVPTSPILTSREAGWEGLMVRTYQEPPDWEETLFPGNPDIFLNLATSGAVQINEREVHGPWRTYQIHKGNCFLTPAGTEPYILRWKSLSSEPLTSIHLHVNADLFTRTVQQLVDRDPTSVRLLELEGLQDPLLTHIAVSLQHELQHPASGSLGRLYAETAAQMLATHLLRHYTTTKLFIREYEGKLSSRHVRRLTTFIQDHLSQDLSLETLARQVGFSPYHFARIFRQTTGESPHQFVLRQRLTAAQRLLQETDISIAQVAAAIGIPNESHFVQTFKRYQGMTPRVYRQQRSK